MGKIKTGTRDLRAPVVLAGTTGDVRQLKCTKCSGIAISTPNGKGGKVYRCTGCGASYTSSPLDG